MSDIARVFVNNIEVGSLPAAEYHSYIEDAKRDWRLKVQQVFNVLGTALSFLAKAFVMVPVVWFLLGSLLLIGEPEMIANAAHSLAAMEASDIGALYQRFLLYSYFAAILMLFMGTVLTGSSLGIYGYRDVFDMAVAMRIRRLLEVPAKGDLDVVISRGQ